MWLLGKLSFTSLSTMKFAFYTTVYLFTFKRKFKQMDLSLFRKLYSLCHNQNKIYLYKLNHKKFSTHTVWLSCEIIRPLNLKPTVTDGETTNSLKDRHLQKHNFFPSIVEEICYGNKNLSKVMITVNKSATSYNCVRKPEVMGSSHTAGLKIFMMQFGIVCCKHLSSYCIINTITYFGKLLALKNMYLSPQPDKEIGVRDFCLNNLKWDKLQLVQH